MRNSLKLRNPFPSVSNVLINSLVKPSAFPNFININFYLNFSSHNDIKGHIILLQLIFTYLSKRMGTSALNPWAGFLRILTG